MSAKRTTQKQYSDPAEAFAARTEWDDKGCLIWVGSRNKAGYGVMRVDGKAMYSHRYAYSQEHGTIPPKLKIDHRCQVRACCNVGHLRTATQKQNLEHRAGIQPNNTSGHRGVYWHKPSSTWMIMAVHEGKSRSGGYAPPYELHVAAHKARALRNRFYTHNDNDKA